MNVSDIIVQNIKKFLNKFKRHFTHVLRKTRHQASLNKADITAKAEENLFIPSSMCVKRVNSEKRKKTQHRLLLKLGIKTYFWEVRAVGLGGMIER